MNNVVAPREKSPVHPPLRLGVVLDSYQVPAWIWYVLREVSKSESVHLCMVAVTKNVANSNRQPILFRFWTALDRYVHRPASDAMKTQDCRSLLTGLSPVVLQTGNDESDNIAWEAANPDLLLNLGHGPIHPKLRSQVDLGVWSLQESDEGDPEGIPSQFRDMLDDSRVFMHGPHIVEQIGNQTQTVYCAHGIASRLSFTLNRNAALWDVAEFLVRHLPDAAKISARTREVPLVHAVLIQEPRALDSVSMARFLARWAMRSFRHEFRKRLFLEQWMIVLRPKPKESERDLGGSYRLLEPPCDHFYADPFLMERDGRTYLFFEDYGFTSKKGLISCCEVDDAGNCTEPTVVLERPYHLSYPFLFKWQGDIYLIPETAANRAVELYRANNFPHDWVQEAVVMPDVSAVDSTLLFHQDKWWLFTAGVSANASPENTLLLFFADSPLGPWTAHPKNPIVSDPRRARPAGNLYFCNGVLVRPGQDCSNGYGYAVQVNRVDALSESDYSETPVARISPSRFAGCHGTHTFNQSTKFQVMDAKFWIPRFHLIRSLRRRMVTIKGVENDESHFQADPHLILPIATNKVPGQAATKLQANVKN